MSSIINPWVPQNADLSSQEIARKEAQVFEYAVDGGSGLYRGFSAFIQIRAPLSMSARVEGFLATYRHPDGTGEVRLTKKDIDGVEIATAQELEVDGAGTPCSAIIIYLRPHLGEVPVQKIVIYPENEVAEILSRHKDPIGRTYGYFDEVPPYRFHKGSHSA